MKEKLMNCYLRGKAAVTSKVRNFMSEERGASDIVAVIALIVIILAVAIVFKNQLENVVTDVFKSVTSFIKNTK